MGEDAHRTRPQPVCTSSDYRKPGIDKKPRRAGTPCRSICLDFRPGISSPHRNQTVHCQCPFPICRIYATTEPISSSDSLPSKEGIFFLPLLMVFSSLESLCS
jgi:hypothetical protein